MTVIIGYKHNDGSVWLGADSFFGNSNYLYHVREPKIFRAHVPHGGPMLIGASGGHRAGFLVRSMALPIHEEGVDAYTYMAEHFVNALRERYAKAGYLETDSGIEKNEAILLIGYQGRLFAVWYGFQVDEYMEDYAAIGAGMEIALGALWVIDEHVHEWDAVDRVSRALEACDHHSPWVTRPYAIMKVEPREFAEVPTVPPDEKG